MQKSNLLENALPVVVILPYVGNKVLMQLRDFKPSILFPGKWGFFGGSIEDQEGPKDCAIRELTEELHYTPITIHTLGVKHLPKLGNILSHSFCCPLTSSLNELKLTEGQDFGLFTYDEIFSKNLYSQKLKETHPVIPSDYLIRKVKQLMDHLDKSDF